MRSRIRRRATRAARPAAEVEGDPRPPQDGRPRRRDQGQPARRFRSTTTRPWSTSSSRSRDAAPEEGWRAGRGSGEVADVGKVERPPAMDGRKMTALLTPASARASPRQCRPGSRVTMLRKQGSDNRPQLFCDILGRKRAAALFPPNHDSRFHDQPRVLFPIREPDGHGSGTRRHFFCS
jgi:hypothetical protein